MIPKEIANQLKNFFTFLIIKKYINKIKIFLIDIDDQKELIKLIFLF